MLSVYNVVGQRVAKLIEDPQPVGMHRVQWAAGTLPSGVYLYRLEVGDRRETAIAHSP